MTLQQKAIASVAAALAISLGASFTANAMPFMAKTGLQTGSTQSADQSSDIIKIGARREMRAVIIGGARANGELNRGRVDGEITYYDDGKYEDGVVYGYDNPSARRYRKLGRYLEYHRENIPRERGVIFYDYGNPTYYQRY